MTDAATPKPPLIAAPIYIDGAVPPGVASAARKAASPVMGALGIAVLAAVAGYFVPKLLDRYAGQLLPPAESPDVEFEVEG